MAIIWWMRRDLRLSDNTALQAALDTGAPVVPLFVADPAILGLHNMGAARLQFCFESVRALDERLRRAGAGYVVTRHADPLDALRDLAQQLDTSLVVANRDYTPLAQRRDERVRADLAGEGITLEFYDDLLLFAPEEILTKSGETPYKVYGPYARQWFRREARPPTGPDWPSIPDLPSDALPSLETLGFAPVEALPQTPGEQAARERLDQWSDLRRGESISQYSEHRNRPAIEGGTSELSAHLRFGTLSPRTAFHAARAAAERTTQRETRESIHTWLSELAWRDFYNQLLFHNPRLTREPYDPAFAWLRWSQEEDLFEAWCRGQTGIPIIDAGMRQLNQSHWMHNRLRMIVASFLTKELFVAWQRGYDYFMARLVDGDPASNSGGWQWAASTGGPSAQPWFRAFNPVSQSKKYDPEGRYIRRWVPELRDVPAPRIHEPWRMSGAEQRAANCRIGEDYPAPIVDHDERRERALELYRRAKKG